MTRFAAGGLAALDPGARAVKPLVQYQRDPIGFFVDVLRVPESTLVWSKNPGYQGHEWDGTPDPLAEMLSALAAGEDVGVESGTGTGKSFTTAGVVLWFQACWDGARVFTFAPKEDQLRLFIWTEMQKMWPHFARAFPTATLTDLQVRMAGDTTWGAWGYAVGVRAGEQVATKAAGMHAPHMLLVNEETPGIALPVLEAQKNTCTDEHNIRLSIGNPDHQMDALHLFAFDEHGRPRPGVRHIRVSALDHPNVVTGRSLIPGAVSRKSIDRRREEYGEDNRLYQSRVRGLSPAEASEAIIKLDWCRAAALRGRDPKQARVLRAGKAAIGVDVAASEAGDKAAVAYGTGALLEEVQAFACPDPTALGLRVRREMRILDCDALHVGVDVVGVGEATVGRLKEAGAFVRALRGGDSATGLAGSDAKFANLRSQMWWQMREDLRQGLIALPDDPELWRDLTVPQTKPHAGAIAIESKDDIKRRLGRSPDKGDAAVYWNYVRDREPLSSAVKRKRPTEEELAWHHAGIPGYEDIDPAPPDDDRYGDVLDQS